MKRLFSIVLCAALALSCVCASADAVTADTMEKVLVEVKQKLDIPAELTRFESNVNTYDNKVNYDFMWLDESMQDSLSVACDAEGRISSYYYYKYINSQKKISPFSKQQIIDFAESFLKKTLPESFADSSDVLVYDPQSYNARGNLRYNLSFKRCKNGVDVRDNYAQITVGAEADKLFVRDMNVYIDYETEFAEYADGNFDYTAAYKQQFPAELVYRDDYSYFRSEGETAPTMLIYRIKDNNVGYIRADNGEAVQPDSDAELYRATAENLAMADLSAGGSSDAKQMLSEQEIAELEVVGQLMSADEMEAVLKKLPYVGFDKDLSRANISLTKNEYDEYMYRVYYNNAGNEKAQAYRYISATVNAKDGTVKSLSNGGIYSDDAEKSLTESQKSDADKKIDEFLAATAGDRLDSTEEQSAEYNGSNVYRNYVRLVNGIKYVDNGIYVAFDAKNSSVRSYSYNFTDKEFADPSSAADADAAYGVILEFAPIQQMYIKHNGEFIKCYTLSKSGVEADAFTGDIINNGAQNSEYDYTDIAGHWAGEAIQKLAEIQVGIKDSRFEPDKQMTQAELLQLLCGGMINKYYLNYTREELYKNLENRDIISVGEKAPDALVSREDAFVYMIRIAELEKVAKLEDIYKVEYADGDKISDGKLGYAAILSGMKVINGSGGYVRPLDKITRAEAATMIYKYLLTF
ncbi:MAG: S-layer homology domain-containing protein [Clostridia bacterium]|nr:S-layer homology domain-containing protein [Clostridia bacterium]